MAPHDTYVTTENFEEGTDHRGHIQILRSWRRSDSHLIFCDVELRNLSGDVVTLHRVDLGKLEWLCRNAHEHADVVTPEDS